jgi:DNA polymerase
MAGIALNLAVQKDKDGHALMRQMAKPRSRKVAEDGTETYTWWDDEARRQRLYAYCDQDVLAECALDEVVPQLSARERKIWELDQHINDKGVALDVPNIRKLTRAVEIAKADLDKQLSILTEGQVSKTSQSVALAAWIMSKGVACTSVAASEHEDLLIETDGLLYPDLSARIRKALELRALGAKSSTAKLKTMEATTCRDGRSRGTLYYSGTVQHRWAGRLWQPQNLKRVDPDEDGSDIETVAKLCETVTDPKELVRAVNIIVGEPMQLFSKSLRSMIVAGKDNTLVGGDKSNIEGRINAWLAGEHWKIKAFRDYDAGQGPDLYRLSYSRSFGAPIETVKGEKRQVGKVQELSLGYQGSVGAFIDMGKNYRVKPEDIAKIIYPMTSEDDWKAVEKTYKTSPRKHGLDSFHWTALKIVVNGFRKANSAIMQGWWDLQDAAIEAVASPGKIVPVYQGRVRYLYSRGFLWCSLASGSVIAYCRPRIVITTEKVVLDDGTEYERTKHSVHYEGYEAERKIWSRHNALYGGQQCAHVVSGFARDAMVEDMFAATEAGLPIVLTVHDELLTEVSPYPGLAERLREIMVRVPRWIDDAGLPMAAKTWEQPRYAK